ncbi:tyrosine-protein phosphatase [Streptomyces pactum]|uniref:Tyrosine-protein phosphatase n=1 Tax=Streptomyces pactum TaxID=68249 RepID=A0ABS0NID0_9ACTN|nr:tyrosine-protein phosphatase [Streptomyces pactum]MBH5334921.1 tyrosine-protein phosphatase [Streptomyces pactum]
MNRHIPFDRLHNFRDLGGYRTFDGRTVRWSTLYRADSLGKLAEAAAEQDRERFRDLGVRTVIDLRYPWEIDRKGRVPAADGLAYHNLSIEHRPYNQAALPPETDTERYLADRFAEVAEDGVKEIRQALEVIADPGSGTTVFHCASGKDRTGLIAALVLSLVGVAEDDIVADFALTNLATERLVADWKVANPGRELVWPAFGTAPEGIMRLFLADLAARYGSVPGYVTTALGAGPDLTDALRARLLTEA